jgi:hypothetical protein
MVNHPRVLFFGPFSVKLNQICMSSQEPQNAARGIPGKWFVIPFTIILVFVGWLVISMAVRFEAITEQLNETRSAWPRAAEVYAQGFALIEAEQSKASSDSRAAVTTQKTEMSKTTLFDRQSVKVKELLGTIEDDRESRLLLAQFQSHEALQELDKSEKRREQLQSGIVGWFTVEGLRLKLPPVFRIESR